jgi:hypothetical protein
MCAHEVDKFGYPVNPELRKLEFHLCDLAGSWGERSEEEIVSEYHATMAELYSLGWDGTLDVECELPREFMPDKYVRRHPTPPGFDFWQWPQQTNE